MKNRIKKLLLLTLICSIAFSHTVWAEPQEDPAVTLGADTETHIVDGPEAGAVFVPDSAAAGTQNEDTEGAAQEIPKPEISAGPGTSPGTSRINLDFTLVKPVLTETGQKYPYFKLVEKRTDENGVEWLVCASGGTKIQSTFRASDCTTQDYFDVKTTDPRRIAAIRFGLERLGGAYQYGGNGPAYDCSGFVHACLTEGAGVASPRSSSDFCAAGNTGADMIRPGDVVGHVGHVGLYLGDGIFIHACDSRTGIITQTVATYSTGNILQYCTDIIGQ